MYGTFPVLPQLEIVQQTRLENIQLKPRLEKMLLLKPRVAKKQLIKRLEKIMLKRAMISQRGLCL